MIGRIPNVEFYDNNLLFIELLKLERYDLLKFNNIQLKFDNSESFKTLIEYIFSNEEILWLLYNSEYNFDDKIKKLIADKVIDEYDSSFEGIVEDNIDYLIQNVTENGKMPKCLISSGKFRDYCINNNRFDLAVQCILPKGIFEDESLILSYCNELNINPKDFYERGKWLLDYNKKNNNIFNSILGTSLKDNIFNINELHYERFINDIDIQMSIAQLNDRESLIFHIYCRDKDGNEIVDRLADSELSDEVCKYFWLIKNILNCDAKEDLFALYSQLEDKKIYKSEIPLDTYIKGKYTELYSSSLFKIDEKNQEEGSEESINREVSYNGKRIKVCTPQELQELRILFLLNFFEVFELKVV